jgi:hypothetical protein
MNTEITVVVNNDYKAEGVLSHDGNAVFRINMLFGSINKRPTPNILVVIFMSLKIHQGGEVW